MGETVFVEGRNSIQTSVCDECDTWNHIQTPYKWSPLPPRLSDGYTKREFDVKTDNDSMRCRHWLMKYNMHCSREYNFWLVDISTHGLGILALPKVYAKAQNILILWHIQNAIFTLTFYPNLLIFLRYSSIMQNIASTYSLSSNDLNATWDHFYKTISFNTKFFWHALQSVRCLVSLQIEINFYINCFDFEISRKLNKILYYYILIVSALSSAFNKQKSIIDLANA